MRSFRESTVLISSCCILPTGMPVRSEEHTSELQSHLNLVCRLLLEKKKKKQHKQHVQLRSEAFRQNTARQEDLARTMSGERSLGYDIVPSTTDETIAHCTVHT